MRRPSPTPSTTHALAVLLSVVFSAVLVSGCDAGEEPGNTGPQSWVLREDLRIGALEGAGALTRVTDLAVGPDGELYVLQPRDRTVRVFGASGQPLREIGSGGDGPGELQLPGALGFLGDTLWVSDTRHRRISLYTADGDHLEDMPRPQAAGLQEGESATFLGFLAGRQALLMTGPGFRSPLDGRYHRFPVLVVSPDGVTSDTVGFRYADHQRAVFISSSGGQFQGVQILSEPFSDASLADVTADGSALTLAHRRVPEDPASATFSVQRIGLPAGDTVWDAEVGYEPRRLPDAVIDSVVAARADGGPPASDVRDALFIPATLPPLKRVVAGADGTTWVARASLPAAPMSWTVFDGAGSVLATLEAPPGLTIHHATREEVWGVVTDELDVPYVVRYVVRSTAPSSR